MERRSLFKEADSGVSPSLIFFADQSGDDLAMDDLSKKMLSWSRLWFGPTGSCAPTEAHKLVRDRLLSWLRLCIGQQASGVMASRGEDVSLATSTPLLTALLGRRAVRELSRRVLNDL